MKTRKLQRLGVPIICLVALLATALVNGLAQDRGSGTKRSLTHQDYDSWRSIQAPQISRDGKFIAYAFMAQDGDSEIVVRNRATGAEWRAPRGYRPPAPPPDESVPNFAEIIAAQARLGRPVFTADSRFVIFSVEPTKAEVNKAKKEKKKPEDMPKNALGIMDVATGQVTRIERVKNFQVPEDGSGFIAYLLEPKPELKKAKERGSSPTVKEGSNETLPAASSSPKATATSKEKKKEYGTDLVLRNMTSGMERTFNDVLGYTVSKDAKTLLYAVSSKKEETNGVYAVAAQNDAALVPLLSGKGKYQKLTWDEDQTELAFISDRDDASAKQPKFKVYLWNRSGSAGAIESGDRNHAGAVANSAIEVVSTSSPGFRKDFVVSEKATLGFSLDGSHLFLGAAPPLEPEKSSDEETPADEKVLVDLWHWKDDYVQPIQRIRAEQERNKSYRATYLVREGKFVQLADESLETISPSNDGRYAIGSDNRAYRITNDYDPGLTDYYLVNTADGTRKLVGQKQRFGVSLSPGARYAIYFDGKDWNSYSIAGGATVNLTKNLSAHFFDEDNDTPSIPGSYGIEGWTRNDREVLIYDRYDIWQVAPDGGGGAKNLTDGVGRRDK